jgi:hypothetical protein
MRAWRCGLLHEDRCCEEDELALDSRKEEMALDSRQMNWLNKKPGRR